MPRWSRLRGWMVAAVLTGGFVFLLTLVARGSSTDVAGGPKLTVIDATARGMQTGGQEATANSLPCTRADQPANFTFFSLGPEFEGLPVRSIMRRCDSADASLHTNYVYYFYGSCNPGTNDDIGCAPPIQIVTSSACVRSLADYEKAPGVPDQGKDLGEHRGVPVFSFDEGNRVEVYTGTSTIILFGADSARLERAIDAIRPEPRSEPPGLPASASGPVDQNLPPPVPGAMTGELPCTATR
jgi:hypothetical protein